MEHVQVLGSILSVLTPISALAIWLVKSGRRSRDADLRIAEVAATAAAATAAVAAAQVTHEAICSERQKAIAATLSELKSDAATDRQEARDFRHKIANDLQVITVDSHLSARVAVMLKSQAEHSGQVFALLGSVLERVAARLGPTP